MRYKYLIFDLDGTLLDTSEGIKEAVLSACRDMGYSELSEEELKSFIGPPIQDSFMKKFGSSKADSQQAADLFREYYRNDFLLKAIPYDSIFQLIKLLYSKGVHISVATFKREDYAMELLSAFGFAKYCDSIYGGDNYNQLTKADIIAKCIDGTDFELNEVVYIGDTLNDYKSACENGVDFIGVTYGFGFIKNHSYEFNTVNSVRELWDILDC